MKQKGVGYTRLELAGSGSVKLAVLSWLFFVGQQPQERARELAVEVAAKVATEAPSKSRGKTFFQTLP